ncbi:MAG TPA: hypothetical protein VJ810_13610, partial [Blastocatellia bacterium]|nr:hypothetical protein [Blastocatellia bacterium]
MSAKHPDTTNSDEANKRVTPSAFETQTATPERSSYTQQPYANLGQEPNVGDDLLKIKGVTKAVEQALKKVGINTYEKLVGYSANRLSNILKTNDPPISISQVKMETIINKASDFTRSTPKQERVQTIAEAALTGKKKRQYERHWENWEELADFFVSFGYEITKSGEKILETRVINYERDEKQQWQDVATDQLLEWIISRSNTSLAQEGQSESRKPELTVRPSAAPAAGEAKIVELTEPVVSEIGASSGVESPEKQSGRLRVENCLKLSEAALAGQSYDKLIALTEIYLYNKQTQQRQMVAHQTCQCVSG